MHRHAKLAVEARHARFVVGRGAGGFAGSLREDHELAVAQAELLLGAAHHVSQGRCLAIPIDDDRADSQGDPAEDRDDHQLLLQHEQRALQHAELNEDVEHGLVLGGDQDVRRRYVLLSPDLHPDPADDPKQDVHRAAPEPHAGQKPAPRSGEHRDQGDRVNCRPDIKDDRKQERTEKDQGDSLRGASPPGFRLRIVSRARTAMYFEYSRIINRAPLRVSRQRLASSAGVAAA